MSQRYFIPTIIEPDIGTTTTEVAICQHCWSDSRFVQVVVMKTRRGRRYWICEWCWP